MASFVLIGFACSLSDPANANRPPSVQASLSDGARLETHDYRRLWYRDADGDGFGDPDQSHRAFTRPRGFAVKAGDCDDVHAGANPDATEALTSGLDDDCDGQTAATRVDDFAVWEAVPTHVNAELGVTMTTSADVNGDGAADLVLGGNQAELDGTIRMGTVTVFDGPLEAADRSVDETHASAILYGATYAQGSIVCSVGDLDADGVDDIVIGSVSEGSAGEGAAYIARGPLDGAIDLTTDTQVYRGESGDWLGGCAGPGDVDGDGVPDVILAAPVADDYGGEVYLLRGPAEQASLADADQIFAATDYSEYLGNHVAALGDLNGDGGGDYAISNAAAPTVPADGVATYLITDYASGTMHPRDVGVILHADVGGFQSLFPNRVGDVDGDGYDDVGIGLNQDVNTSDTMYVFLGPVDDDAEVLSDFDIELKTAEGERNGERNSWLSFAAPLGDWNGDGLGALAIADAGFMPYWAPNPSHCDLVRCSYGAVFVMAEPIEPGRHDLGTEADRIDGVVDGGYMGGSGYGPALAGGTDLNGDGAPDLAFSAWEADSSVSNTGRAYVLFGDGSL